MICVSNPTHRISVHETSRSAVKSTYVSLRRSTTTYGSDSQMYHRSIMSARDGLYFLFFCEHILKKEECNVYTAPCECIYGTLRMYLSMPAHRYFILPEPPRRRFFSFEIIIVVWYKQDACFEYGPSWRSHPFLGNLRKSGTGSKKLRNKKISRSTAHPAEKLSRFCRVRLCIVDGLCRRLISLPPASLLLVRLPRLCSKLKPLAVSAARYM